MKKDIHPEYKEVEAACTCARAGVEVHPEVMIPLVSHVNELRTQREVLEAEARVAAVEVEAQVAADDNFF